MLDVYTYVRAYTTSGCTYASIRRVQRSAESSYERALFVQKIGPTYTVARSVVGTYAILTD